MKIKLLFGIFCALFALTGKAQEPRCGTDEIHKQLREQSPRYFQKVKSGDEGWSKFMKDQTQGLSTNRAVANNNVYTIPIVFHVIHSGQPIGTLQNPSDNTIISLLNEINQKLAATYPGYGQSVNVPIQYVLAKRTPDCQPTNGIVRINASSLSGYSQYGVAYNNSPYGAPDANVKALSYWDNKNYYNFYIVTEITGDNPNGGGVGGYANYPGAPNGTDAAVIACDQLSWASVHELGHSLGLRHTFEGSTSISCTSNSDCMMEGDLVCDTEPHLIGTNCPTGINSCTGTSIYSIARNLMSYYSCPDRFTAGQRDRMLYMLENLRPSLLTSYGAVPPNATPLQEPYPTNTVATACVPGLTLNPNSTFNVGVWEVQLFEDQTSMMSNSSEGYISNSGLNFYIDNTNIDFTAPSCLLQSYSPSTKLTIGKTHSLYISGWGGGQTSSTKAWIDFNNNGVFETGEMVFNTNGQNDGWISDLQEFTIPATAVTGTNLRMRIYTDFFNDMSPCSNPNYGEIEDYTVWIMGTLGTGDFLQNQISIYPNPVKDILTFSEVIDNLKIADMTGKVVIQISNSIESVDVSQLANGMYIISATTNKGYDVNYKVIKN